MAEQADSRWWASVRTGVFWCSIIIDDLYPTCNGSILRIIMRSLSVLNHAKRSFAVVDSVLKNRLSDLFSRRIYITVQWYLKRQATDVSEWSTSSALFWTHCSCFNHVSQFLDRIAAIVRDSGPLLHTECHGRSVCLSVGHVREPCESDWTDREAVWGLTQVGPMNHC